MYIKLISLRHILYFLSLNYKNYIQTNTVLLLELPINQHIKNATIFCFLGISKTSIAVTTKLLSIDISSMFITPKIIRRSPFILSDHRCLGHPSSSFEFSLHFVVFLSTPYMSTSYFPATLHSTYNSGLFIYPNSLFSFVFGSQIFLSNFLLKTPYLLLSIWGVAYVSHTYSNMDITKHCLYYLWFAKK